MYTAANVCPPKRTGDRAQSHGRAAMASAVTAPTVLSEGVGGAGGVRAQTHSQEQSPPTLPGQYGHRLAGRATCERGALHAAFRTRCGAVCWLLVLRGSLPRTLQSPAFRSCPSCPV